MIKTIVSDLGGVVVKFNNELVLDRLAPYTKFDRRGLADTLFVSKDSEAHIDFELGRLTPTLFFNEIAWQLGLKISEDEFFRIWTEVFTLNEPVFELWRKLKNQPTSFKLVALSNVDQARYEECERLFGLRQIFDHAVLSYREGFRKPDRRIFERAIDRAFLVPSECVFIDDLSRNVEAAREAGFYAVQYTGDDKDLRDNLTTVIFAAACGRPLP